MPTELHLALQRHYAGEGGLTEVPVAGFLVDALREGVAYEIQTGAFAALRPKLEVLCAELPVVLVYPVPQTKVIVRVDPASGEVLSSRRSPKRGAVTEVFWELLYLAQQWRRGGLELEVLLTVERELRAADGRGSWRRKGVSVVGRELVEIVEARRFATPADLLSLVPPGLPERFTVAELAEVGKLSRALAGRMAYALRKLGVLEQAGKRGNAYVYERAAEAPAEQVPGRRKRKGHRKPVAQGKQRR